MTDTEQVYALYVQANPVPDPDLQPLTPTEAELLIGERSTDMDTRQKIEVRPTPEVAARRRPVFGLAAILVVAAVGAGALLLAGDGERAVAAADAAPEVVFDGDMCRYEGPTLIEKGTAEIKAVNASTERMTVAVWSLLESRLDAELARWPLGTDQALPDLHPFPSGNPFRIASPAQSEMTRFWPVVPGTYIIDCIRWSNLVPTEWDHMWRAQTTVEVVAP